MPVVSPIELSTATTALSTGVDHWLAVTSTGSTVKWYVDGSLVETASFSMRAFRGIPLIEDFGSTQGTGAMSPTIDVRNHRMWTRVLSSSELSAEAASATPVSTTGLVSDVGLTSATDLTDTVASIDFTSSGTPGTASGYCRLDHYNDRASRVASFLDASLPFSYLFHVKIGSGTPDASFFDVHTLGPTGISGFDAPYLWIGNDPIGTLNFYLLVFLPGTTDAPHLPVDTSEECCCSCDRGGSGTSTGEILPYVDPAWTPSCTGGGAVDTASDLTDSEDWRL